MMRLGAIGYGRRIHGMIANNFRAGRTLSAC
jgi:hypothetical protein